MVDMSYTRMYRMMATKNRIIKQNHKMKITINLRPHESLTYKERIKLTEYLERKAEEWVRRAGKEVDPDDVLERKVVDMTDVLSTRQMNVIAEVYRRDHMKQEWIGSTDNWDAGWYDVKFKYIVDKYGWYGFKNVNGWGKKTQVEWEELLESYGLK